MGSILEEYMKQVNLDKENEDNSLPSYDENGIDKQFHSIGDMDNYVSKLSEMRNDPNDMANRFHKQYPHMSENELSKSNCIKIETITAKVIHAYCPECGRELICKHQPLLNPYANEKIAKHECICGYKANLDYAYPRIEYTDSNNNKVIVEKIL